MSEALTNYLAYRSLFKTGETWAHELNASAMEISAIHYPPKDEAKSRMQLKLHRAKRKDTLKSANSCANRGVDLFDCPLYFSSTV